MSSLRAYLSTSIPEEMDSYLEGLIRGVLKHQPPDINQFAMQYFQSLVDIRKQKGEDKTVHQNVDNYPLIISVKNKNPKRMNNEHSSKQETREISDAKESSLEDTNMTCSEMNSLTRDECFSLQDKSFNSLTFQQSPGHKNIASSLDETDTSFLYTGRNKDGFSSLDQPATSFSGPESDVKVESQSEIHTELESSSNSTLEICQSRKDQISEKDMGTPTVSPDFENVLNRQESGEQDVDGDLTKESDSVQDASLKVSEEHISSGQSEECTKTEISKLGNELKSEDVQIHENSDINVENNAVEANTSSNEQCESPQQIAEEIVIDEKQKDVETSPGTEHTPKELSKETFDNTAGTAHNNTEAIHVSATESDKIETKVVLEEGIIDKTDGLETNQKESVETFPETENTLNEISKETFDTTDDTAGNNTSVFKSDEEKNLERSEEHDKITSEETLDKENIRPITESSDVVNENIETFEEDPLSIIQESENLKPTEAGGLEANQKECAETSSHDKDNLEAMVKFSDAISPVSTPPKGENLETSIESPGLDKMDSAAKSADTVQNKANQMEKVDAEDAISANVEEIPTNSEALGVVETPEGNVKICPEIIVQDNALVFDDEAVLEENLGPDTKDSIETISELVEGNDESSGKDNEPISSEYFLKVPEVTLEDGLVAKEKKAEEITEEVDATFEYNEDHSKKAEKMNTIEEVFQEDHEGNTGGNEVASEEPIDVDTESGNEKSPKDDNGEHEIRIIRSTDDLNAQVETLEEEILGTPHILEIAEPIQEVSEDDGKDASNDKGEETSKPILDEEISTGEISSDLDDTKETVNEISLKDDTVDHDNTKDLVIGEKQKSIDFNEVLGQVNEADLKVVEIEELKHIDDIISSAVKVDSLNLDSSQSDSNATLTSDKTEKSSGITLTTDINEKFADTEINEDIEDSLPVKLAAPVMISKVIEIKQLDEISDEESLQHVQASDVTSIEEEDLLRSVNIGGVPLPKQELPFAPIIITTVVKAKVRDNSDEHIPEPSQAEEELDRLSNVSTDTTGEVVDETQMLSPKLEESDNQDVLSNEESLSEAKSTVDQSLLEEHEIFEILTSVDLTEEKAESISAQSSLSPSSTHDSDRKPLDDGSPIHEITRQPIGSIREESEDHGDGDHDKIEIRENNNNIPNESGERKSSLHCVGVEATAVRQLAASTGTVAILGTTAKPPMKKSASGNLIEDENAENADIVEVVIEHNNIIQSNSGTLHQTIEAIAQEVRTDLIQNGVQKISKDETTKVENTAENEKTVNNNTIFVDENLNSTDQNAVDQPNLNKENYNAHITSELTNKVTEAISISEQNHISNVNIAPSNIDNQISQTQEVVTNKLESKLPESNIANYDSTVKAPSLEEKPSSEEVIVDNMDQSNTNIIPETRTNNNNVIDKQSKVPLAKHFKQEVNTSEVVKQKSKSSKESSLEKEITVRSFDKDRSIDSNNTDITNLSKTSSLEQHSESIDATQSQIKTNNELTKLPSIESKAMLPTVADAVEDIIASATNIVLEKTKAKITEKPHSEVETFDTESKKSVSNDLDSDSNGTSDQTVISQESLNEENMREGVTNVTISKNTRNKSIELETEVKENDLVVNGELKDEIKKEILPDINGIIKEAEEHVNNYNYELTQILENGVPDEDSVSLISKNSFDKDEVSLKESIEKKPENEEKPPSIPELETIPKKVMRKDMSLSLTSQEESSIEISPENDVSNTVSETSDATKDIFTPHSGNSERTPHDETPLSEDRTPRVDFPLSDSMMDDLRKEIDGICDEAVARIATATTKIQAGYRGYKTRKSLKQTNNDIEGQGSFDGADLPPPDLERLGSIHEDDPLRGPPDEVPDFDTDPDFHVPPASTQSDSMSESLSSAATKIQAGVRGYLTRKQVKQGSSTTVPSDSDFSETSVTSQDPLRSSTDLETQVQRVEDPVVRNFHSGKRMSLDSNLRQVRPYRPPLRSVMSERDDGEDESPDEIWRMLTQEADKAAVLIQSSFRGYQARKKLSRGDAVHMPTTSSSATPSSTRSEDKPVTSHRGTGEFHDSVFGSYDRSTNPTIMVSATRNPISDENEAAAKIQAGFRGYKVRRDLKDSSRSDNTCSTSSSSEPLSIEDKSAAKIQAGVRGYLVRKRKNEEKKAATKIQAGFRGYKTRKELKSPSSDEGRSLC